MSVLPATAVPPPAPPGLTGTIRTVVGSPGERPGPAIGQQARAVAIRGDTVYVADSINGVIRALDITTGHMAPVGGLGSFGHRGDGGPATYAQIDIEPGTGLAFDVAGALYFADSGNNRIRKIDTAGVISTVAGTGVQGFSGDGGLATAAALNEPTGVAVDGAGNLYIADWRNHRIRKVDASGVITTFAGTGAPGNGGDGVATTQALNFPMAVTTDAGGNVYVADTFNHKIRRVTREASRRRSRGRAWAPPWVTADRRPWPASTFRWTWNSTRPVVSTSLITTGTGFVGLGSTAS